MADSDIPKIAAAAIAAGSIGTFGGHTLSGGETIVNASSIESCSAFIQHAARHEQHECELRILKIIKE
ncbi:MAG: hypothetical protein GY918_14915 [Gammaproteobacteria bacterium]|nr:hypothetical protein [Gammaproteobacteria bacterium]